MSNLRKYHPRILAETLFLFRARDGIYMRHIYASETGRLSPVHIQGTILFPKLVSAHAYLRVLFMKYVAVYRIGVIRSRNCIYDVPSRNLVAFETKLSTTKRRKRDV